MYDVPIILIQNLSTLVVGNVNCRVILVEQLE
jgi:hypothetical protein